MCELSDTERRNINDRRQAEDLHQMIGEVIRNYVESLPTDRSRQIFFRMLRDSAVKNLPADSSPTHNTSPHPLTIPSSLDCDAEEAIGLVDEIRETADMVSDAGQDFAQDVLAKAVSIGETIERSGRASAKQVEALENMLAGLQAWIHD